MLRAPEPLREDHSIADFQSGEGVLDDWLQRRALKNQRSGASRTFVVTDGPVIAYYALAAGAIVTQQAPG